MTKRKYQEAYNPKKGIIRNTGVVVGVLALITICISAGVNLAVADNANTSFNASTANSSLEATQGYASQAMMVSSIDDNTMLTQSSQRDISKGVEAIAAKEEAARIAAEEAAAIEEARRQAEEAARKAEAEARQASSQREALALGLVPVNWDVSKEDFIAEWTTRIDAYLAGSPLAGQGAAFAEAAWNYSVDPRWSPAISNTESTKGRFCFLPCNAWGWGSSSWSSWPQAIDAHVQGLANGYGSMISYAGAVKYCPPNADHWYKSTLSEMMSI